MALLIKHLTELQLTYCIIGTPMCTTERWFVAHSATKLVATTFVELFLNKTTLGVREIAFENIACKILAICPDLNILSYLKYYVIINQ